MSAQTRFPDSGWRARCSARLAAVARLGRGTAVLAAGDAFADAADGGKSEQVLRRLQTLNPRLRIHNACAAGDGLAAAGLVARAVERRRFDAVIVFVGNAEAEQLDTSSGYVEMAETALHDLARVGRRVFLVGAFDHSWVASWGADASPARDRPQWLERTLRHLCELHGAEWMPLQEDDECSILLPAAAASLNFSVGGFHPLRDGHEMWTARMLQQPALAQLVFR